MDMKALTFRPSLSQPYSDVDHSRATLKTMYNLWQEGIYCDITVIVEGQSLKTHKLVLSSLSEYFKTYLQRDAKDKAEVELDNTDFESLQSLIHYAYTGEVTITDRNVQNLFIFADYTQVLFVREACEKFMIQNVEKENCSAILQFADCYSMNELKKACLPVVGRNLKYVSQLDGFADIPYTILLDILRDDHLVVFHNKLPMCHSENELAIFKAALQYISGQRDSKPNREESHELVKASRLSEDDVSPELLLELAEPHKLLLPEDYNPMAIASTARGRSRTDICSHIISDHRAFAAGGEVNVVVRQFDGKGMNEHYDTRRLSKISVVTRDWDDWKIVGGLHVYDGKWNFNGLRESEGCSCNIAELESSEVIVKVTVRYGWVINCISFTTSSGRCIGPFGGDQGGVVVEAEPPSGRTGFLHSFSGAEVDSQGGLAITNLKTNWTLFDQN
ncbi:kelch-like protein 24 [Mizuhopecten yessoensis]|uniref:kelch-like protein 24 n=1 Tax=Mizuhopecten yessoensis TaxID=6573 RepID=UPI000B45BDF4|nr:kelch-like protein 24 [Mizuhopecten yessoensis]